MNQRKKDRGNFCPQSHETYIENKIIVKFLECKSMFHKCIYIIMNLNRE